ncbi:MAG: hypothetical protein RG740_06765 [Acholeplasmataceae bacterium]|nr:hypothetical protein [Acholeplasmataceae bacterium]
MSRIYKLISTTTELEKLQREAEGDTAVGISPSGALYIWDGSAKKINVEKAAEILETTQENITKLVECKGAYEIVDEPRLDIELASFPEDIPTLNEPAPDVESDPASEPDPEPEVQEAAKSPGLDEQLIKTFEDIKEDLKTNKIDTDHAIHELAQTMNKISENVNEIKALIQSIILE